MDRLVTTIDKNSSEFRERREKNLSLSEELLSKLETVKKGGGGKYVERHLSRGKLPPRERISKICDPNSPFLELSSLAANGMYDTKAHSAGLVTGIGIVMVRSVCL